MTETTDKVVDTLIDVSEGADNLFSFTTWVTLINPKLGLVWMAVSKVVTL